MTACDACGVDQGWSWYQPTRFSLPAFWARQPCQACKSPVKSRSEELATHRQRLEDARIPQNLWGKSLERTELRDPGMPADEWARSVLAQRGVLGLSSPDCVEAVEQLRCWDPNTAPWLYIYGPVGTGKSQMVAAKGSDALRPQGRRLAGSRRWRTDGLSAWLEDAGFARPFGNWVWAHEEDVIAAVKESWIGNRAELLRACSL